MTTPEKKHYLALQARNEELEKIIQPLRSVENSPSFTWQRVERAMTELAADLGGILDMNPDFQRGHVWTEAQQQLFVENIMRGIVPDSQKVLQFNCPILKSPKVVTNLPNGLQCVDGLQRYTTALKFVRGEIKPFGFTHKDLEGSSYDVRSKTLWEFRVMVLDYSKKSDLLKHYLTHNRGGVIHSDDEINRVSALLAETLEQEQKAGL
ncbi:hypothetical protein HNP46_000294 [Pseudomonas nitritireducens]|uniref:GmrSD restriction endonucleases N-terminal domain-containing protein n=1 Tax=Pseudomonas nitroreducens TaxID=46680 RepID=A0A7W7KG37_PSENT|nr:DUF262 domain-containing protein [Pseudomonas nitritireducens]MBB4861483.1 hypothetical protein [Pseudomonas nitritireducens]